MNISPPDFAALNAGKILFLKNLSVSFGDLPLANERAVNEPMEFPAKTLVRLINLGDCRASLFKSCKLKAPKVPPPSKDMIRYVTKITFSFLRTYILHYMFIVNLLYG
ncbi:hypothetical protein GCM10007140_32740 [Priestia taiwanensis]|uniref:Uncharacterized protein n=1 Tax=Priestia taiwanensis TaxID=1347902 RepID=A0A917AVU1_9BACI|nr:hypothetical protein GCM10007140_32740 [Priestia taiwanensis]